MMEEDEDEDVESVEVPAPASDDPLAAQSVGLNSANTTSEDAQVTVEWAREEIVAREVARHYRAE